MGFKAAVDASKKLSLMPWCGCHTALRAVHSADSQQAGRLALG
jgi:hypothetical protein